MSDEEAGAAVATAFIIIAGVGCVIGLAIQAFVCWLLSGWLKRVPAEHRKQEPGMVWLLMIPLFPLIWNFWVYPKIAESFDSYFASKSEAAESAGGMARLYCILAACSLPVGFIPILGGLFGIGVLVLWIILLVKLHGLSKKLPEPAAA